jgi:hypothetical protein
MLHQVNITIHVIAGSIALLLGIVAIAYNRIIKIHRRVGRYFKYLLVVVVLTGFIGFLFFRHEPFFLMLTLIAGYVGYAGFRNIKLREQRSTLTDVWVALVCSAIAISYAWFLIYRQVGVNKIVPISTLAALVFVTTYDLVKYYWLHERLKKWWLYEHIYKVISAFSAMLSAFAGNVLTAYHPYSQLGPSLIGLMIIVYYIFQRYSASKGLTV